MIDLDPGRRDGARVRCGSGSVTAVPFARLVHEQGVPDRIASRAETSFDGGRLTAADLENPERLGQAVARQVYAELAA